MKQSKIIIYDKKFLKNMNRRFRGQKNMEKRIADRIDLFLKNKNDPILRDHKLLGTMRGIRSFSISGDVRIIYLDTKDHYVFIDIGTHNQIYNHY